MCWIGFHSLFLLFKNKTNVICRGSNHAELVLEKHVLLYEFKEWNGLSPVQCVSYTRNNKCMITWLGEDEKKVKMK